MKVRCPVCEGSGGVEPTFHSGCAYCRPGQAITVGISVKQCPACGGTGMQEEVQ